MTDCTGNCSQKLRTLQKQWRAASHEPFVSEVIHFRPWEVGTSSAVSEGKEAKEEESCRPCRWNHSSPVSAEQQKMNNEGNTKLQWKNASGQGRHCQGQGQPLGSLLPVPTTPGKVCFRAQIVLDFPPHWFYMEMYKEKGTAKPPTGYRSHTRAPSWCISKTLNFIPSLPVKLDLSCSSSEDMSANCSSFWFSFFTVSRQVKFGKQS